MQGHYGILLSAVMAYGTKLLLKRAGRHLIDLYLRPDGSNLKCVWRGSVWSLVTECARRLSFEVEIS